jgi:hypothetical protein
MPWLRDTTAPHGIWRVVPQRRLVHAWKSLTRQWPLGSMMLPASRAVLGSGQRKCRQRKLSCRSTRHVSSGPGTDMPQSWFL